MTLTKLSLMLILFIFSLLSLFYFFIQILNSENAELNVWLSIIITLIILFVFHKYYDRKLKKFEEELKDKPEIKNTFSFKFKIFLKWVLIIFFIIAMVSGFFKKFNHPFYNQFKNFLGLNKQDNLIKK